ncbi:hypothetical protein LO763_07355 [Glycomyces sp. A-F 0318]|uniref:hypothetical protein n=1 Tax=Glycomyces amatae TaxID=2881355 RepID=UPI001E2CEA2E|nr:hypothetical protein [Glycomyces amatae]MCD0443441.1 hypothetical protein [Glycomyces amatae]
MKIRTPLWMPPAIAPVGVVGVLPIPLVEPDAGYAEPGLWLLGALVSVLVMVAGFIVACFPGMKFEDERFLVRGKYGWDVKQVREEGERWVIAGDRLCLQRQDGSLVSLGAPRWMVRRGDWRRLEASLPVVDAA